MEPRIEAKDVDVMVRAALFVVFEQAIMTDAEAEGVLIDAIRNNMVGFVDFVKAREGLERS